MNPDLLNVTPLVVAAIVIGAGLVLIFRLYRQTQGRITNHHYVDDREAQLTEKINDLTATVATLLTKLNEAQHEIETLRQQLMAANSRITELERAAQPQRPASTERVLLAVIGNEPGLKLDLAALREVEVECGITVTRCSPPRFGRFEATLNRYRAAGTPIKYVHFSVHASAGDSQRAAAAALFEDGAVDAERLSGVLNGVEVAFVAGCDAEILGDSLGVVPTVITFKEPVSHDQAALATKVFWLAIGRGLTPRAAYREARNRLPAELAEFLELHQ